MEDAYGHVRVRGEITGFRGAHSSGHCYFALKDDEAKIEAVIWKFAHARMRFKPQEGLEVIATGKLTTFPGSSKYQIVIEALEPAGIGALMALMEERKKKLAAEGLFDAARKQLLPLLPEVIGVITSPTGAVIRDILHRLQDRFPRRVLVWPVRVQGEGSAEQIAAAIRGFNAMPEGGRIPRPDLLIVARGGGSLEDLWSFNEEIVVRAAAASTDPADLRGRPRDRHHADRFRRRQARADADGGGRNGGPGAQRIARSRSKAWPAARLSAGTAARTTAATSCARPRARCPRRARCSPCRGSGWIRPAAHLPRGLKANTHAHFRRFAGVSSRLTLRVLRGQVAQARHRLLVSGERLTLSARSLLRSRGERYVGLEARLKASKFAYAQAKRQAIARERERTHRLAERARRALVTALQRLDARVTHSGQLLTALSYRSVLARGFALVRDEQGHAVRAAASIGPNAPLTIEFGDGRVGVTADADRPPAATVPRDPPKPAREAKTTAPKRVAKPVDQGSLF